jgi:pyrroloquinoline quinone (PQQ) biosynthesis protein C
MNTSIHSSQDRLLKLYDLLPFEHHPYWRAVKTGALSYEQVIKAEVQHWLRSRAGRPLRKQALDAAQGISPTIFEALLKTYLEECTDDESGPSHLELIERLVTLGGIARPALEAALPTPGNAAAIALYRDIGSRGAGCHVVGAGVVEHFYSRMCPHIFAAYTEKYGMSSHQAETYSVHGPMDAEHAARAFAVIDEAIQIHGMPLVEQSVRDAFVATSLHYDGMLQAATGTLTYWDGRVQ